MPDNETEVVSQSPTQENSDLDMQMQLALTGKLPEGYVLQEQEEIPPQAPAPVIETTQQPETPQTPESTALQTDLTGFTPLSEKFGYSSIDDAIKEIEELRQYKANPTPAEIKYENEESAALHKAIEAGETDKIISILNKQAQVNKIISSEVTKDTAEEIVKLAMQLDFKDLTPAEINYKFNKQFGLPPKPVQTDTELDEEYENRLSAWKEIVNDKEMDLLIEAKMAKPKIETMKASIKLPALPTQKDEEYEAWKAMKEQAHKSSQQAQETYKAFTPKNIETKIDFNDEASKVKFQYQYEPDTKTFEDAVNLVSDVNNFFNYFKNSDGSPNNKKFLDFVIKGLTADKMVIEGIKQGSNARFKSLIPANNSNASGGSQMPPNWQPTELDQYMQAAGIKKM